MKIFDLNTCLLEGVNLIEASAGTGKTYALAGLFLRFLIEKKLSAGQILVITFTNAATAELKNRIRRIIVEARQAFQSGQTGNEFIGKLLDKYPEGKSRNSIIQQLTDALANYDETSIYTIHGFCQRVLADNAFASGLPFDIEFIADQNALEKEFVEDFWRKHFYDNHQAIIRYAVKSGFNIEMLQGLLKIALAHPEMKILPESVKYSRDEFERAVEELGGKYDELKNSWFGEKEAVLKLLKDKALNGQTYGKKVDGILRDVEDILQNRDMPVPVPDCIAKLSSGFLKQKTNKDRKTPSHPLFDLCQGLCTSAEKFAAMMDRYFAELKKKFFESAKVDFPGLKKRKNILYFDDLLNRACEAVRGPEGGALAEILRRQYAAVLVDEFQDTDPIQYAILQTVFMDGKRNDRHPVFYIGDPKQAIYSFRGADIHAYLRAEKSVDHRYTMTSNWRSESTLLNAINVLFGKPSHSFVYSEIAYTPVERPAGQKTKALSVEGECSAGLHWWFLSAEDDGKPIGVAKARSRILRAVIREIARLLKAGQERKALIGEEPLSPGDIAILVRKNTEALAFKNALMTAGISSVVYSSESVFTSRQADDLRRLMLGVIYYENEGYLLSALNTPFFAWSADDISECLKDSDHFERIRMKFKQLNDIWHQKGFLTVFLGLLEEQDVRVRIASLADGERRLTNYVHLAQLLFQMQKEGHLQPSDLLRKLEEMMVAEDNKQEEQQQKLETDRDCIKIVTVHRSKGLEYPVVFCPFAWEKGKKRDKKMPAFFHDEENEWQAVADLGSDHFELNLCQEEREGLAEDCRLLYVALTRAKNRCYMISGNIRDAHEGAVSYLFHRRVFESGSGNINDSELLDDLRSFAGVAPSDIELRSLENGGDIIPVVTEKDGAKLTCRKFKGSISQVWKIASYTYLAKAVQEEKGWDEEYYRRPMDESNENAEKQDSILYLPPGATSGILLHEILEKVDFMSVDDDRTKSVIDDTLMKFNYPEGWRQPIAGMLKALVNAGLKHPDGRGFRLSDIGPNACRKEMEFYFPLQDISSKQIASLLEKQPQISGLSREIREKRKINIAHVRGYLKGFIDLVFEHEGRYYLADWKSNNLGDRYERYDPVHLEREVFRALYDLQYLIYTVALNQYLATRIQDYSYDRHFGGVYYFFLRGIDKTDGSAGIYFDRPDRMLIKEMTEMMMASRD